MKKDNTKPKNVNFHQVPGKLWRKLKKHIPNHPRGSSLDDRGSIHRDVINGIWYILWTGSNGKRSAGVVNVSSSVLHERFQTWKEAGVFDKLFSLMVKFYARERKIGWKWQSVDSKSCAAPLGGRKRARIDRSRQVGQQNSSVGGRTWRSFSRLH